MSAHKRIVCDIDDTISFTLNRDWDNAIPNQKVIDKINDLYSQGWEIFLVTARGSLSCTTRNDADTKYRSQIEKWLNKHNVQYNSLSFNKYLASYYVDDKSLTPEQFIELDIKSLQNGWSGATVELREGKVFKTHKDSLDAAQWYDTAKHFFNVPKIYSLIGDTICMEYIKTTSDHVKMDALVDIIIQMKNIPVENSNFKHFEKYQERINKHLEWENTYEGFKKLNTIQSESMFSLLKNHCSFCHGDFTLENTILRDNVLFLIDPIYESTKICWSSYILDMSKMLYSLRRHGMMIEYNYFLYKCIKIMNNDYNVNAQILQWFEMTHIIRVYKYAPVSERTQLISMFEELYNKFSK